MRQTTYPKGNLKEREWFLIDVKDCILGRAASFAASIINGKTNPMYTPYANNAPGVIIINAKHVKVTGNKLDKPFYWHTGFPGGIKKRTMKERLESKVPTDVFYKAVERMVNRGPLGRLKMKNLRVFAEDSHTHGNLKPKVIDFANLNDKNNRGSK